MEEPPRIHEPGTLPRYIAPADPEGGGTWIAINEYGLLAAVLNWYSENSDNAPGDRSRGCLPVEAVGYRTASEAFDWANEALDPSSFRPFLLFLFGDDGTARSTCWDGNTLTSSLLTDKDQPVTTSSFDSARIEAERKRLFKETVGKVPRLDELLAFHAHHDPERPELGPAMVRDDATTRSLIVATTGPTEISLRHQVFLPEQTQFLEPTEVTLPRRFLS